jgi:hypothetical protein
MAVANPFFVLLLVTKLARFFTSDLALPIAIPMPLCSNIGTSLGISPIAAIALFGIPS